MDFTNASAIARVPQARRREQHRGRRIFGPDRLRLLPSSKNDRPGGGRGILS